MSLFLGVTQYVIEHLNPALGWQKPLFQMGTRLMPCRSERFDFPLTSHSSPPILCLPSYHWGYLSFRSIDLLPPFFFLSEPLVFFLQLHLLLNWWDFSSSKLCCFHLLLTITFQFMSPISQLAILLGIVFPSVLSTHSSVVYPFSFNNIHWPRGLMTYLWSSQLTTPTHVEVCFHLSDLLSVSSSSLGCCIGVLCKREWNLNKFLSWNSENSFLIMNVMSAVMIIGKYFWQHSFHWVFCSF